MKMDAHEITEAQLLAYLDGELDADTAVIIQQTPRYRQRAAQLAQLQQTLAQHLAADAPSPLALTQYQLDLLPPEEAAAVAAYLAAHPHAARQLQTLQAFLQQGQPAPLPDPRPAQSLKVWIAQLLAGGGLQPALAGLRGQAEHVYRAGDRHIVLDLDDDPGQPQRKALAGLIMNRPPGPVQAHLWALADPSQEWETAVDEDGNFIFTGLPEGDYTLLLRAETAEIYIESLTL